MFDSAAILGTIVGLGIDPFLLIPAMLVGWFSREWWLALIGALVLAMIIEGVMAIIHAPGDIIPSHFGHLLLPRFVAALVVVFAVFGLRRLVRRR